MKSDEILELVRAGFTKEEIMGMQSPADPVSEPETEPEPETDPEPEQDTSGLKPDKNVAEMDAIKATIEAQTKELKQLRDQLIAKKINEGQPGKPSQPSIYDVWAESLNK